MKRKYKRFLKAAYINYEEDYCSNAVLRDSRPPLSEILAPATFELTLSAGEGYYWTTFYTSMANYLAPEGVTVYKEHLDGKTITHSAVDDRIINKRQGVVLRSSTSSITLTKTYSRSSDNYSDNSLLGTDYKITNPGHAYVLSNKSLHGIGFYKLSSTGTIKANKAYLIIPITYLTQWKIVGNSEVHTLPYPDGVVLPNGYKRCEYIQSDGVAYIELPYGFKVTDNIYIKCAMLELVDWGGVMAPKRWDTRRSKRLLFGGTVLNNSVRVFTSSFGDIDPEDGVLTPQIEADTNTHEWSYSNNTFTLDGNSSKTYSSFGSGSTDKIRLFYGHIRPRKCRIYDYRHTKDNTEYHLIPCLDSNDTPCMYDVINNQAYYNSAGSGSFTYELYPQPTEIWSCGEYNAIDGKYHILVQPQGGSIADIALTEPLRKVNDVADTIEFPSGTEGKALVTRNFSSILIGNATLSSGGTNMTDVKRIKFNNITAKPTASGNVVANILCSVYETKSANSTYIRNKGISVDTGGNIQIYDPDYNTASVFNDFKTAYADTEIIFELAIPTTELVDAPQIEEAESYTCVISQGAKAVSWSSFDTE